MTHLQHQASDENHQSAGFHETGHPSHENPQSVHLHENVLLADENPQSPWQLMAWV